VAKEEAEQASVDEGGTLLSLVQSLAELHAQLPSFAELFAPHAALLGAQGGAARLSPALHDAHEAARALVELRIERAIAGRRPLRLQRRAPVPIKLLNPVFDDDFQPGRDADPDRERAQLQLLKRKAKKEHKGAARELRKDGAFLAGEREREKRQRDDYLEARGRRAVQIMQEQEHAWKQQKKVKRDAAKEL